MKTTGVLLLLLGCCLAEIPQAVTVSEREDNEVRDVEQRVQPTAEASAQQACQADIHTALREMSVLITEQRVELQHAKAQLATMGGRVEHLLRDNEGNRIEVHFAPEL